MKLRALLAALVLALVGGVAPMAQAQMKLQFYYPVGVAGPLARIIDGYVQEWNKSHPQVQVEPVFAGNYTEAYAKTLAAIRGGTPAGRGDHAVPEPERHPRPGHRHPAGRADRGGCCPGEDGRLLPRLHAELDAGREGLVHPLPAVDAGHVLQQGRVQGGRARPEQAAPDAGRAGGGREEAHQAGGRPHDPLGPRDPVQRRRRHLALRGAHDRGGRRPLRRRTTRAARCCSSSRPRRDGRPVPPGPRGEGEGQSPGPDQLGHDGERLRRRQRGDDLLHDGRARLRPQQREVRVRDGVPPEGPALRHSDGRREMSTSSRPPRPTVGRRLGSSRSGSPRRRCSPGGRSTPATSRRGSRPGRRR